MRYDFVLEERSSFALRFCLSFASRFCLTRAFQNVFFALRFRRRNVFCFRYYLGLEKDLSVKCIQFQLYKEQPTFACNKGDALAAFTENESKEVEKEQARG